jgi:hypothetical protein
MLLYCWLMLPDGPDDLDITEYEVEVQVEDVTRADAPARVVGRVACPMRRVARNGRQLGPILLSVTLPDPDASYNVRAVLIHGPSLTKGDRAEYTINTFGCHSQRGHYRDPLDLSHMT